VSFAERTAIGFPRRTAVPAGARAANGLGSLSRNGVMDSVPLNWANQLAATKGPLGQKPNYSGLIPGGWGSAAENVARGYPDRFLRHDKRVGSSGHRSNLLNDSIDVGIASEANVTPSSKPLQPRPS